MYIEKTTKQHLIKGNLSHEQLKKYVSMFFTI